MWLAGSAVASIGAVFTGLMVFGVRALFNLGRLLVGGRSRVWSSLMHYTAMWAVRIQGKITYAANIVLLSIVIAAIAVLLLAALVDHPLLRGVATLIMDAAITGMNYTGMAAVQLQLDSQRAPPTGGQVTDVPGPTADHSSATSVPPLASGCSAVSVIRGRRGAHHGYRVMVRVDRPLGYPAVSRGRRIAEIGAVCYDEFSASRARSLYVSVEGRLMDDVRDQAVARALGEELRRARESIGWTRDELVDRMASEIQPRTLASYEHGSRYCTVVRLTEICRALRVSAPELLGIALQRAEIDLNNICIQVDLDALTRSDRDELTQLRTWAKRRLAKNPDSRVAILKWDVVQEMAIFFDYTRSQLVSYLTMFTPSAIANP